MLILNRSMLTLSTVIIAIALANSACSVKTSASGSGSGTDAGNGAQSVNTLDGIWSTGCSQENGAATHETLTLQNGVFSDLTKVYMNATCDGSPMMTMTATGTFSVGGPATSLAGARDLNVTITGGDVPPGAFYTIALLENGTLYLPNERTDSPNVRPAQVNRQRPFTKIGG